MLWVSFLPSLVGGVRQGEKGEESRSLWIIYCVLIQFWTQKTEWGMLVADGVLVGDGRRVGMMRMMMQTRMRVKVKV